MRLADGEIKKIEVAADGWSAWVTLQGLGKAGVAVNYKLDSQNSPNLSFDVTDDGGAVRKIVATEVIRKPYPNQGDLDNKIVGDDLVVHVALSEFVFATNKVVAFAEPGWANLSTSGGPLAALAESGLAVENHSAVAADQAAPVANFVTPDRQVVGQSIHVEVIAGSIFADRGSEVSNVRFVATDEHGKAVTVVVDKATLSTWGSGDARPVYSYGADIATAGLTQGDLITVRAEVVDHIGNVRASAPNGSIPGNPAAFTDQIYRLDADGSYGKAYAYVSTSALAGTGSVSSDPLLAAAKPFSTIGEAMIATQAYDLKTFGRANLDNAEIRLMAGTHTWVATKLSPTSAVTDDTWLTITRDPAATQDTVRITGPANGANSFAYADHIKIDGLTIDRSPMGNSTAAIMRGASGDALWLNDVVFDGRNQTTVSFQIPDIWVTQSEFNNTGKALSTFGADLNMFRIRGVDADANAGTIVNGHLLVGSDLHNLAVRFPTNAKSPGSDGAVIAFNEISNTSSTQLLGIYGDTKGISVIGNVFDAISGVSPAVSISADGVKHPISNIIFHNNVVTNERVNVGYNDVFGADYDKILISLKWNDLYQLNTKHDVFSKDSNNAGAWSVLYGVGFEENIVHNRPAGSLGSFGLAFDGLGSVVNGIQPELSQQDVPDLVQTPSPPAAVADMYTVNEDTILDVSASQGVLANDFDLSGDGLAAKLVVGPTNGQLTFNGDGSFRYVPNANFNGDDSFSYIAIGEMPAPDPVTVRIAVASVNDVPIAGDDFGPKTVAGADIRLQFSDLLANDSDDDGDPLNIVSVQDAKGGRVAIVDGQITFATERSAVGEVSFAYTVSDGHGGLSSAIVRVPVIAPANRPPVLVSAAAVAVDENQTAAITLQAIDPDDDQHLGFSITGGADAGLFAIDASSGTLTFITAPNYEMPTDADTNNIYEVRVRATDNGAMPLFVEQNLLVTVKDVNEGASADRPPTGLNTMVGGASADTVNGTRGNDLIRGLGANDWLDGKSGDDWLFGGDGNDNLVGGTGNDVLIGGSGADQFRFDGRGLIGFDTDQILDLSFAEGDRLVLSNFGAHTFKDVVGGNPLQLLNDGASAIIDSIMDIIELDSASSAVSLHLDTLTHIASLNISVVDGGTQIIQLVGMYDDFTKVLG